MDCCRNCVRVQGLSLLHRARIHVGRCIIVGVVHIGSATHELGEVVPEWYAHRRDWDPPRTLQDHEVVVGAVGFGIRPCYPGGDVEAYEKCLQLGVLPLLHEGNRIRGEETLERNGSSRTSNVVYDRCEVGLGWWKEHGIQELDSGLSKDGLHLRRIDVEERLIFSHVGHALGIIFLSIVERAESCLVPVSEHVYLVLELVMVLIGGSDS